MNTNDRKINHHYIVAWSTVESRHIPASFRCVRCFIYGHMELLCVITATLELKSPTHCVNVHRFLSFSPLFFLLYFFASICPFLHLSLYVSLAPGQSSCLLQRHCGSALLWRCLKLCQLFYFLMSTTRRTLHDENNVLADTASTPAKTLLSAIASDLLCLHVCDKQRERY